MNLFIISRKHTRSCKNGKPELYYTCSSLYEIFQHYTRILTQHFLQRELPNRPHSARPQSAVSYAEVEDIGQPAGTYSVLTLNIVYNH